MPQSPELDLDDAIIQTTRAILNELNTQVADAAMKMATTTGISMGNATEFVMAHLVKGAYVESKSVGYDFDEMVKVAKRNADRDIADTVN